MKNKVVIITGASSGIGEACAIAYANKGAKVIIAARNVEKLNSVAEKIEEIGTEVLSVQCDVSVQEDCRKLIEQAITKFGRIDILINNAGISMRAIFNDMELDVMEKIMAINFFGTVYCTKFALPHILKNKNMQCKDF